MKKIILAVFIVSTFAKISFAQDPHFSQIQYNPIYLNPANAGVTEYNKANRIAGLYRDQWRTLPVPYSSTFGSYDRVLKKFKKGWLLGGGISFIYDKAGDGHLSIFNPNLTMSAGKYFNKEKQLLTLGVTAGITIKTLDELGLTWDSQYNLTGYVPGSSSGESFSNNNVSFPNFTVGLNFRTKIKEKSTLDIGASASNLHEPKQNFLTYSSTKLPARYSAYAKAKMYTKKGNWNIQPGIFFQNQRKFNQILTNVIAEVRMGDKKNTGIGFGAGYRAMSNDAAIAYISFLYKTLRVGGAYDFNVSGLRKATNTMGAFELALNYEFGEIKSKHKKCDTIRIKQIQLETDTVFIHDTIQIEKEKTTETKIPCDKIAKEINQNLPAAVYFDNDIPNPRSIENTTSDNYKDLYDAYLSKKNDYSKNTSEQEATELFDKVTLSYQRLETVFTIVEKYLKEGKKITLNLRGYASPLAKLDYNYHLSKRRIESVKNYLLTRNNGSLKEYLDNGNLKLDALPLGKFNAPVDISDKLNDKKNSIFGKAASLERRVEIINVNVME